MPDGTCRWVSTSGCVYTAYDTGCGKRFFHTCMGEEKSLHDCDFIFCPNCGERIVEPEHSTTHAIQP